LCFSVHAEGAAVIYIFAGAGDAGSVFVNISVVFELNGKGVFSLVAATTGGVCGRVPEIRIPETFVMVNCGVNLAELGFA